MKNELPERRLRILNSIDFDWDPRQFERTPDSDAKWNERFHELKQFKEVHGHTMVPQGSGELGRWVKMQREQKKSTDKKNSGVEIPPNKRPRPCMPPDRISKLDSIGFCWESETRRGWEERYEQLLQYRDEHGDCNVPQLWPENRSLGRWVMKQRCHYKLKQQGKKSQLTDEKQAKLEAIGFAWTAPGYNASSRKRKKLDQEEADEFNGEALVGGGEEELDEVDEVDVPEPAPFQPQPHFQADFYAASPNRRWLI
jgi:hypothetical protein